MSCIKQLEEEMTKYIIKLMKECTDPEVYGINVPNNKTTRQKRDSYFKLVANMVNDRYLISLSDSDIKNKWMSVKKSFMISHKRRSENPNIAKYYLYEDLKFLIETGEESNVQASVSVNHNEFDSTENGCNDEDITFQDIEKAMSRETAALPIENEAVNVPIMPAAYKTHKKRMNTLSSLETLIVKKSEEAFEILHNIDKEDEDQCFIESIVEALKNIPAQLLLQCVNEILIIINEYIKMNL